MYIYREVVTDLIEEYKAAEGPDYVSWGSSGGANTFSMSGGGGNHSRPDMTGFAEDAAI